MASEPGATEPAEPGRVIGGKYRLVRRLAEGGMGEVWLARHEILDADVAVKLMSAEIVGTEHALARFEREAKASAKLKSNHIVRVQDFGVDGDTPFMVMELLEGEDLGTRLKRDGPMTVDAFVPVLRQIAKGLEVAHAAGFVHRDLKPSNIFLAREGGDEIVKVVDFGVARETKTKLVDEKTGSGVVLGSPHHMSPEQALGEKVDHRSDLWALAVVVYRALAGRKPFDSDVLATLLLEIVSQPVPKISEVKPGLPADLDRYFARALHRKPSRRFQSASAMADALEAIAEGRDLTTLLTVPEVQAVGRDEATAPSVDPEHVPSAESRDERSASRALTAVTAGVPSMTSKGVSRRPLLWAGIAVALIVGAFFVGRSGLDQDSAASDPGASVEGEPEASASTTETAPVEEQAPEPAASATTAPSASASATGSAIASPPAPPVPVAPWPRPAPVPPSKPAPKPAPKVDPFTGIATP